MSATDATKGSEAIPIPPSNETHHPTTQTEIIPYSPVSRHLLFRSRISEVVQVRINRADIVRSSLIGQHSEYIVEVNEASGERSTVSKRYKNFLDLHAALTYPENNIEVDALPTLPPKRIFGNLDANFIEDRRYALETYLQRLLRHPSVSTKDPLWVFLDVDDATIIIARFLGPLSDELHAICALEDLKALFRGDANLNRVSQDLVIERLVKCGTLEHPLLLTRTCLTLTQICLRCPKARQSLVRFNAIPTLLTLLERFPSDAALTLSAREFIHSLIREHPPSLVVFFRTQHGLSQIHRISRNTSLSLFHSFLALLLWWSINKPELQAALAEPDSLGIDVLGSLYRSPNACARLFCGLVVSFLILNQKFHSTDLNLQAARSVSALPAQLSALSCRRERLDLQLFPTRASQRTDIERKDSSISFAGHDEDPIAKEKDDTSTVVELFDFGEFDTAVLRSMELNSLDIDATSPEEEQTIANDTTRASTTTSVYNKTLPLPALLNTTSAVASTKSSSISSIISSQSARAADPLVAIREKLNRREREEQLSINLQELDYALLYAGCCSTPKIAQRIIHLLQICLSRRNDSESYCNSECTPGSTSGVSPVVSEIHLSNDQSQENSETSHICSFLLWIINLVVARSRHRHRRGLVSMKDFTQLSRIKHVEGAPHDHLCTQQPHQGSHFCDQRCSVQEGGSELHDKSQTRTCSLSFSEMDSWSPTRDLQKAVMTEVAPIGMEGWSPSTVEVDDKVGPSDISMAQENIYVSSRKPEPTQQPSTDTKLEPGTPTLSSFFSSSPFHLRAHLTTKINQHNQYLIHYLAYLSQRVPPWQAFSAVPKSLQVIESLLIRGSSEIIKTYAASILLHIPWTVDLLEKQEQGVANGGSNKSTPPDRSRTPGDSWPQSSGDPTERAIKILPMLKDAFSTRRDRAALGADLESLACNDQISKSSVQTDVQSRYNPSITSQSTFRSLVPSFEFLVPQRLLHQRVAVVSALLKFCEVSTDAQREELKSEELRLQRDEHLVNARQANIPLRESFLDNFSKHLKGYLLTEKMLRNTTSMSAEFLAKTRIRLETQGLTRSGLTVAAAAVESELEKLSSSTERLFDMHSEVTRHAIALRDVRTASDSLLKIFVDLNAEFRRTQEAFRTARREAQHKRERWIDLEQYISQAPERRKRVAEQVAQREAQEEAATKKLAAVQRALTEAHVSHNDALAQDKKSESALNVIETAIVDLENWSIMYSRSENESSSTDGSGIEAGSLPEKRKISSPPSPDHSNSAFSTDGVTRQTVDLFTLWNEVLQICGELPSYVKEQEEFQELLKTPNPTFASRIREILHSEAAELRSRLATPGSSERLPRLQQLTDRLKRLEAEKKKRSGEAEKLRNELQAQSDLQSLIEKSSALQAEVRTLDAEAQRLATEVETLEAKVRSAEVELETKKTKVRACEGRFFSSREVLLSLIDDSNNARCSLCHKILNVEQCLGQFLSDMTSVTEDASYASLNRLLVHFTLSKESRTRQEFRLKIKEMVEVLLNADKILSDIDDSPL